MRHRHLASALDKGLRLLHYLENGNRFGKGSSLEIIKPTCFFTQWLHRTSTERNNVHWFLRVDKVLIVSRMESDLS
jgi:hypothetical protein